MKNYLEKITRSFKDLMITEDDQKALIKASEIALLVRDWVGEEQYEKISLGENCNSSWYLKETNNKKASYPYDWIFSSPQIIEHTIKDDFKSFLNKSLMYSSKGNSAGHQEYHDFLFNHRNPLNSDESYNYYVRSVDRFKNKLANQDPALFLCTVVNEPDKRPKWSEGFIHKYKLPLDQQLSEFRSLIDLIKSINPNTKFLFLEQYTEGYLSIEVKDRKKDLLWIEFISSGINTGVKYLDRIDDTIVKILFSGLMKV